MAITLKAARVNAGFTQRQVADLIGISRESLCGYENGVRDISVSVFEKLCHLYKMNRDDIFLPYNSTLSGKDGNKGL